jgi:hypothetical protein
MSENEERESEERESEERERQIAGLMSAALVTVATFSLTVMGLGVDSPEQHFVDEIFMVLGLSSLFSAGRIIDYTFDQIGVTFDSRRNLLGYGYFLFCTIVGAMSFAILLLYASKSANQSALVSWTTAAAAITWVCITGMLMTRKRSGWWAVGAGTGFLGFIWRVGGLAWLIERTCI